MFVLSLDPAWILPVVLVLESGSWSLASFPSTLRISETSFFSPCSISFPGWGAVACSFVPYTEAVPHLRSSFLIHLWSFFSLVTSFFGPERWELHITFKGKAICSQNRINSRKSRWCFGHHVASLLLALQWKTWQPFLWVFPFFLWKFLLQQQWYICGLRGSGMRNAARWKTQTPRLLQTQKDFLPPWAFSHNATS